MSEVVKDWLWIFVFALLGVALISLTGCGTVRDLANGAIACLHPGTC